MKTLHLLLLPILALTPCVVLLTGCAVLLTGCSGASANTRADRDRGLSDAPIRGDLETEPMIGDLALGVANFKDEELDEAEPAFQRHLKKNPKSALAYYYLGLIAMQKGQTAPARKNFQKAVELNPQIHGAFSNLGVLYLEAGEDIAALKVLLQARELAPDDPRVLANVAAAMLRRGLWTEAVEAYKLANKLAPAHGTLQYDLALAYMLRQEWQLALDALELSLQVRPKFALAHAAKVASLQGLGKLREADTAAHAALDECEPLADNYLVLARVLMAEGATGDAQDALEKALKLGPDNANVQLALAELLDARGQKAESIKWYETFLKNKKPLQEDTRRVRDRLRVLKEPAGEG